VIGYIVGALIIILLAIRYLPFIPLDFKIQAITYAGLILVLFTSGAGVAFLKNIFVGVIIGAVVFILIKFLLLDTLPKLIGG
jgi:flagellar biosynthesis protein FlhB